MIFLKAKNGSLPNWLTSFAKQFLNPILPYQQRRKIRFKLATLASFFLPNNPKLKTIADIKTNKKILLIFGITTFAYRHQRSQHFADGMAKKGYVVMYIEPEFLPISGRTVQRYSLKKVKDSIYSVRLASPRNYFIYSDYPTKNEKEMLRMSFLQLRDHLNQQIVVAKIDHPFWECILSIGCIRSIYDCMDEHASFPETTRNIIKAEERLLRVADRVLVSSDFLHRKVKKGGRTDAILISNGVDIAHFSKKTNKIPKELNKIPHPIIGYYGAIESWLDEHLIKMLLLAFPRTSFVFIGEVHNAEMIALSNTFKNLYLLGEKSYKVLPEYVHQFQVVIIPFKLTPLIQATNPIKFFEYTVAGKTIVTTALPELRKYKETCFYCDTKKQFVEAMNIALKKPKLLVKNKQFFLKNHSWEEKNKAFLTVLKDLSE
jgi:hypothetical protein